MAFWDVEDESSVTTYVLPELRETTLVWTFTLSNSVIRACGIRSVKARSSSGDGLRWVMPVVRTCIHSPSFAREVCSPAYLEPESA
jgi:hypothetical protein